MRADFNPNLETALVVGDSTSHQSDYAADRDRDGIVATGAGRGGAADGGRGDRGALMGDAEHDPQRQLATFGDRRGRRRALRGRDTDGSQKADKYPFRGKLRRGLLDHPHIRAIGAEYAALVYIRQTAGEGLAAEFDRAE